MLINFKFLINFAEVCRARVIENIAPKPNGALGYVEKDGIDGQSSGEENVFSGDILDINVKVVINKCYQWLILIYNFIYL